MTCGLSPAFRAWFRKSLVVDERGCPKVVWHATNAEFDVFDATLGSGFFGAGIYVAERREAAENYGERILPLFARAERPIDLRGSNDDFDAALARIGVTAPYKTLGLDQFRPRALKLREDLLRAGFDSARINTADGAEGWVLFRADQVKHATQNRGTFDPTDPSILRGLGSVGTSVWYHGSSKPIASLSPSMWTAFDGRSIPRPFWLTSSLDFARLYARGRDARVYSIAFSPRKTFPEGPLLDFEGRYLVLTPEGLRVQDALLRGDIPLIESHGEDDREQEAYELVKAIDKRSYDVMETGAVIGWAKKQGYDSLWVRGDGVENLLVIDSSRVRIQGEVR